MWPGHGVGFTFGTDCALERAADPEDQLRPAVITVVIIVAVGPAAAEDRVEGYRTGLARGADAPIVLGPQSLLANGIAEREEHSGVTEQVQLRNRAEVGVYLSINRGRPAFEIMRGEADAGRNGLARHAGLNYRVRGRAHASVSRIARRGDPNVQDDGRWKALRVAGIQLNPEGFDRIA